jgi:hypothetical protein
MSGSDMYGRGSTPANGAGGHARAIGATRCARLLPALLAVVAVILGIAAPKASAGKKEKEVQQREVALAIAKIYFEYNSTPEDLGVHVFLDGEDWKRLKIVNPKDVTIFQVQGRGPYSQLGMTELFFEGAEPALSEFPLEDLLELFPEGEYEFEGLTVDGEEIEGTAILSHAIPDGPEVSTDGISGNSLVIEWDPVDSPPEGFPDEEIEIVGYQVIVGSFQVTLPATATQVTVPPEFVDSLASGEHQFEVLAIDASGNQTITEGYFTK